MQLHVLGIFNQFNKRFIRQLLKSVMDNSVLISRFFFNGLQQKMCLSEICFRKYSWIHYDLKGNLIVFQTFHFDFSLKVFKFQKDFWIFICWTYIILVYSQFRLEWIWKLYVLNISVPLWRSWKMTIGKLFSFVKIDSFQYS